MSSSYSRESETDADWIANAPFRVELKIILPLVAVGVAGFTLAGYLILNPPFFLGTAVIAVSLLLLAVFIALIGRGLRRPRQIGFFTDGFTLRYRGGISRTILWAELQKVEVRRFLGMPYAEVQYLNQRTADPHISGHAARELELRFKQQASR